MLENRMGTWHRGRDEDLALFHDMRARECNNFLHPSNDDIEASLSTKFGGLSGYRVEGSTPTRRGTGDLLVLDEKSDYNWLLTPPGTPLFPSLDQDVPIIQFSQRGALTRSASASKTSRLSYPQELSSKVLRGNRSPHRPGTATSTSSTTSTNRGRSSSPSITSSSPILRSSPPSCRPTTPTRRTSPTSRSLTPDLRRLNTSPVIRSSSVSKAGSPSGNTRGKSLSPKLRPWEPSMPGFSSEPPPNLRTSLSDRSSTQRGGSRSSRPGGTAGSRNSYLEGSESSRPRRHSATSPDAFRSWSLSSNQDYNSSQTSKGSVISSCDDDTEMTESIASGSTKTSSEAASRNENPFIGRCILPAKRQTRPTVSGDTVSVLNITSKRSYERQVDRQRSSQSMFRPLLSSIPASSFYSSRAAGMHHRPTSSVLESSITLSSNGRTEQGMEILLENETSHGDEEKKESAGEGGRCLEKSRDFAGKDDEQMNAKQTTGACAGVHFSNLGRQETKDNEGEIGTSIEDLKDNFQGGAETEKAKEAINARVFLDEVEKLTHASDELSFSVDLGDAAHISESKILEANGVSRMPKNILFVERSAICMGRDLSMERKEMLPGATFTDARDVSEVNSSFQSSAASVCDLQSNALYQRPLAPENIAAEDAAEQSSELMAVDGLLGKTLSGYSDSFGKEDILSIIGVCDTEMVADEQVVLQLDNANLVTTAQHRVDMDTVPFYSKLPAMEDAEGDNLFENSTHDEASMEDIKFLDGASKKQQPGATLKRNVTLEEATDTILFCNSIVNGIVYKAAAIALQREEDALARNSGPKREHITLFGRSEAEHRNTVGKDGLGPGNWKQQPAGSAIQRTFRYVQKRRMVHQQTPTVILQQSPMDRTENAIIGNQEEDLTQTVLKVHQKKTQQPRKLESRCSCSIM